MGISLNTCSGAILFIFTSIIILGSKPPYLPRGVLGITISNLEDNWWSQKITIFYTPSCQTKVSGHITMTSLSGNPLGKAIMTFILTAINSVISIFLSLQLKIIPAKEEQSPGISIYVYIQRQASMNMYVLVCLYNNAAFLRQHSNLTVNNVTQMLNQKLKFRQMLTNQHTLQIMSRTYEALTFWSLT